MADTQQTHTRPIATLSRIVLPATAIADTALPRTAVAGTSARSMLRTVERVLLRDGGHRTALHNARAAVLEGEARAAHRAETRASLLRLSSSDR